MILPLMLLLRDAVMDMGILFAAQLCFGRIRIKRLAVALICMQSVSLAYFLFGNIARHPFFIIFASAMSACALTESRRILHIAQLTAYIITISLALGGVMTAFGEFSFVLALAVLIIATFLFRKRMHIRYRWHIEVFVREAGSTIGFRALIDTGNRLQEPVSALPVLIVCEGIIPQSFYEGKEMRCLSFGVLGSSGKIPAFRAESVMIRQNGDILREAPECYIAVFPGKIPGGLQALAPPEFTDVLEPLSAHLQRRISRRKKHAVFKHQTINLWSRSTDPQRFRVLHRRKRPASAAADPRRRDFPGT